jgi:hypothetical protein
MSPRPTAVTGAVLLAMLSAAHASTGEQTITIRGHYDNAVGTSDAASQGTIDAALLKSRPALRPGEVLEFVPGVIVTQHSGDGKANQYFLRGFNLDHGTDFATRIAGMPVNMPSHAHGQGYTDLNILLPELVQRIDYRKGPYFAVSGDFASAGAADIVYRRRFDAPFAQLTLGRNGFARGVAGGSGRTASGLDLLGALELQRNDGPWTVPERLRKVNGALGLAGGTSAEGFSLLALHYDARWTATDQVPQRLLDAGRYQGRPFGPWDSLDDSSGGDTRRSSLSGEWHRSDADTRTRVSAYAIRSQLELFSNFSYALERPDDGDQFRQAERRSVFGADASQAVAHTLAGRAARSEFGVQLRHDRVRLSLADSVRRRVTAVTREDEVRQTHAAAYAQTALELAPRWRAVLGLRADHAQMQVAALTLPDNGGRARATQISPKLALVVGPFDALPRTEFFFNAGRGLHSNDARGTTIRVDPKSGEPAERVRPLVAQHGDELGLRTEIVPGLQSSLSLWRLRSASELVYVGDAGTTEASAASRRRGVEFSNRYVPVPWLLLDADLAWTRARLDDGSRIPGAVDRVASLAATVREAGPWSASLQWRYLGPGALVEDDSVRSKSSLTANLRIARRLPGLGREAELTLDVFNLLDRRVDDIQYFYASRLPGESEAVADRHVHPAEPRSARLTLRVAF